MKTTLATLFLVAVSGTRAFAEGPAPVVRHGKDVAPYPIGGGQAMVRLLLDGSGAQVAVDELTIQAGVTVPMHKHDTADEILYILEGSATTTVGGKPLKVGPGDILLIPKGVLHQVVVDAPIKAVQVYSPGGPEQRFKQPPPKAAK